MSLRKSLLLFVTLVIGLFITSIALYMKSPLAFASEVKTGTITGKIMIKNGGPLAGGQVLFYDAAVGPPPSSAYLRISDITKDLDQDGRFVVELPAGKYYIGAIKRLSGERFGMLDDGDYQFTSTDEKGKPREYVVKSGQVKDLGILGEATPIRKGTIEITPATAIEGIIVDMNGQPVDEAVVVAFANQSMTGKPRFISEPTDKNGRFILRLYAGTYYLRVRNTSTSGPPVPGQIVGYYGEGTPAPVSVKDGEIKKEINFKVIRFRGRGPNSGATGFNPGAVAGPGKQ